MFFFEKQLLHRSTFLLVLAVVFIGGFIVINFPLKLQLNVIIASERFSLLTPDYDASILRLKDECAKYSKSIPENPAMKLIILAMTDGSFIDIAINLYVSSFKRFDINNYLFIGLGRNSCLELVKREIHCLVMYEDIVSDHASVFGSDEFRRKMNFRTDMIITVLRANYSILHTDLDVVFLRNPMPEIENLLYNHSMAILWDHVTFNAGFLAIKPTPFSLDVYYDTQYRASTSGLTDQAALNEALSVVNSRSKSNNMSNSQTILDRQRYLCGKDYYEQNRNFPSSDFKDNCPNCMVVHNNWIVSQEAKIYRFKETSMWFLDDDRYYSDENRKYLLLYNPLIKNHPKGFDVRKAETLALGTGFKMAAMLNRTLIIPRFHCNKDKECPLNDWFNVKLFHNQFSNDYRESSFLLNDLVPWSISMKPAKDCSVTNSNKELHKSIATSLNCNKQDPNPVSKCISFNPKPILILTEKNGILVKEMLNESISTEVMNMSTYRYLSETLVTEKFGHCPDQVMVLSSLLDIDVYFTNQLEESRFKRKFDLGFVASNYIQTL